MKLMVNEGVLIFLTSFLAAAYGTLSVSEKTACVKWDVFVDGSCYPGKYLNNGICTKCPEGTYMTYYNTCPECFPFSECEDGQIISYPGDITHDRICGDFAFPDSVTEQPTNDHDSQLVINIPGEADPTSPSGESGIDSHGTYPSMLMTTPSPANSANGPCSWNYTVIILLSSVIVTMLIIAGL